MLRESRSREKADGVDRDACIVDRQQFFNTQVTSSVHWLYFLIIHLMMDMETPSTAPPPRSSNTTSYSSAVFKISETGYQTPIYFRHFLAYL